MLYLKERFKKYQLLENVVIQDISAEGMGIGRTKDQLVVFAEGLVPGDVAHVKILKIKGSYVIGELVELVQPSPYRTQAFCKHFGYCGGCKWQNLSYEAQLRFKKKFIEDAFTRIGHLSFSKIQDPLPSPEIIRYRNKLEFTFSSHRWLEPEIFTKENKPILPALGFHKSGAYDKVLDIQQCFLQQEMSNQIRNFVREYAIQHQIPFFDIKKQEGILRTLIIRCTTLNEWMVVLGVYKLKESIIHPLLDAMHEKFPFIHSLQYAHLYGVNESLSNGVLYLYKGKKYITEQLGHLYFRISAHSFFQINSLQAKRMYDVVKDLAGLSGKEILYDLYSGTGTIGLYVADKVRKIIGIEYVQNAVEDAIQNAQLNNIHHAAFFSGDIRALLNDAFIEAQGFPDVLITNPPRAGMHKEVIQQIQKIAPSRIVYISCSPPSQARDISFLANLYRIQYIQPVDMFPHTTHIENIVLLEKC